MEYQFGKIRVINGDNNGRFPFCNTLFIDDTAKVIIDPACSKEKLLAIRQQTSIDFVFNTHFHFDHISYNYLFPEAGIFINSLEADCFRHRPEILQRIGVLELLGKDYMHDWLGRISRPDTPQSPFSPQNRHEWWLSTARPAQSYQWGDVLDFGATKMEILAAPGHSAGFSCFFFPNEKAVYTGDIDLTSFGPWVFGNDCDIDLFIESANRLTALDAEFFITAHEEGIVTRQNFQDRLTGYLEIIDRRDEKMLDALDNPMSIDALCMLGLIYDRKFLVDEWVRAWNYVGIRNHLKRLMKKKLISCNTEKYFRI